MRTIDQTAVEDIARGSAVLASAGGGDPYRGMLATSAILREYGSVPMVTLDELPADTVVSTPFLIGAPMALLENFPLGIEIERAMLALERYSGVKIGALFAGEIGGVNSMLPIGLAAKMGIPVLDADAMGRAYPQIDQTLLNLAGHPMSPMVMTDDDRLEMVVDQADARMTERVGRHFALEFGASIGAAAVTKTIGEIREGLVPGSMSLAQQIGVMLREAGRDVDDAWSDILTLTGGAKIFEGRISGLRQDIEGAFGRGLITIEGMGADSGDTLEIVVINENLSARTPNRVVACAPDIITVVDASSGLAMTTENVRYGYRVMVVALPCDERWLTPAGLALGGPERFHFDFDYAPFAGRGLRPVGV